MRVAAWIGLALALSACRSDELAGEKGLVLGPEQSAPRDRYAMANGCFAIQSKAQGAFVSKQNGAYRVAAGLAGAAPFFLKPTGLGTYLLYDADRQFLGISDPRGELLDVAGNFVGDAGRLTAGVGDSLEVVEDLKPVGDAVREVGETVTDSGETLADTRIATALGIVNAPNDLAVWVIDVAPPRRFTLASGVTGQRLTVSPDGTMALAAADATGAATEFDFVPHTGCAEYPEAQLNASGVPFKGNNPDGTVFGFADTHIHISAYEFIGGRVNYGAPFHKFGVTHALDDCAENHGPNGSTGGIEHFTSGNTFGLPVRLHQTQGWPTFRDWPHHSSLQHHQTYYVWIKRAWMAGLRLMVNHLVGNESLCQAWPLRRNDCDEMENAKLQHQRMHELQDYIDAQEGGPGKGWFRIVTSPAQARQVIADGKLAVVIGMEFSKPLNCGEFMDQPECSQAEVDARLDQVHQELEVRTLFPIHRFDNAFGGAYDGKGTTSVVLGAGNTIETGHPFDFYECGPEEQDQNEHEPGGVIEAVLMQLDFWGSIFPRPPAPFDQADPRPHASLCNARGLTPLGEHLIGRMMDKRMLIEVDHMGERVRDRVLRIIEEKQYPLVSSHGFLTTDTAERRVVAAGGMVNRFAATAPAWVERILKVASYRTDDYFFATGFASDINGIAGQPGPRGDAADRPLPYPFKSYDGRVAFDRQVTGERVYDLNLDGVAHYGLYADLVADMQHNGGADAEQALRYFFRSAEAYLQMWERAERR